MMRVGEWWLPNNGLRYLTPGFTRCRNWRAQFLAIMPPADGITLDYLYDPDGYLRERHKWDARHQILEPEQR